ncbi:hypothetical protein DAETH_25610 [Deinococcus aetherius]|uniref:Uncharacterized protein n=1 Tax=Deinococcus aetherius TaxID=200252 RepID=A0ABN6RLW1_9DEIO|nr:hypothetical protein [Deinococcus aetherius]BDP42592.1 hypothetical protein DAETH_25610 [Deinococcus aetherius]
MRNHRPLLLSLALLGTTAAAGQPPEATVTRLGTLLDGYKTSNDQCFTPAWVGAAFSKTGVDGQRRVGAVPYTLLASYPRDLAVKLVDAKIKSTSTLGWKPVTEWEKNTAGVRRVFASSEAPGTLFEVILPDVPAGVQTVVCFGLYRP